MQLRWGNLVAFGHQVTKPHTSAKWFTSLTRFLSNDVGGAGRFVSLRAFDRYRFCHITQNIKKVTVHVFFEFMLNQFQTDANRICLEALCRRLRTASLGWHQKLSGHSSCNLVPENLNPNLYGSVVPTFCANWSVGNSRCVFKHEKWKVYRYWFWVLDP